MCNEVLYFLHKGDKLGQPVCTLHMLKNALAVEKVKYVAALATLQVETDTHTLRMLLIYTQWDPH